MPLVFKEEYPSILGFPEFLKTRRPEKELKTHERTSVRTQCLVGVKWKAEDSNGNGEFAEDFGMNENK